MGRFLVVFLLAVGFSLAAGAPTTSAHFDSSATYTHRGCPAGASTRSDPVNVVFHGWGTWGRAASQVESHAGWRSTSGSGQFFLDNLLPVTIGNVIGGGLMVGAVYWLVYLRPQRAEP